MMMAYCLPAYWRRRWKLFVECPPYVGNRLLAGAFFLLPAVCCLRTRFADTLTHMQTKRQRDLRVREVDIRCARKWKLRLSNCCAQAHNSDENQYSNINRLQRANSCQPTSSDSTHKVMDCGRARGGRKEELVGNISFCTLHKVRAYCHLWRII